MKHSIYVVDDNVLVREAIVMLIEEEPDLAICGAAETAIEALEVLPRMKPDLVLTDYSLHGLTGIDLIERLASVRSNLRVAVLSAHMNPAYADQALAAGAMGYILKGDWQSIVRGIRCVLGGNVYVSPSLRVRRPLSSEDSR